MKSLTHLSLFLLIFILGLESCTYEKLLGPSDCDPNLSLSIDQVTDTDCGVNEGSISVSATGGAGILRFQLDELDPQDVGTFNNLAAGNYTIKVLDENNCTATQTVEVKNLNGINIDLQAQASACGTSQGSIQVQASGGQTPYEFRINGGAFQTGAVFANLPVGMYTVQGVDANGCEISKDIQITTGTSLLNDIKPIIDQNCALAACHGGAQSPDLRSLENVRSSAARIKVRTGNRTMPRGGLTLSQAQIDLIACWVDDGAPNN
ncbi:MAG: c-type cytochrome [Microscillaceae bacterium]|nr:c-type cytochrome [Microscillaceae bacterium]